MTIIAERGLFVRLLVQSGKFESRDAEALADALDATTREPATKADLAEVKAELKADLAKVKAGFQAELADAKAELKADIARLSNDVVRLEAKVDALQERLLVRLGIMMAALFGIALGAVRLMLP